ILSEKYVSIPELDDDNIVFAKPGFSVIATANSRDRGVNDLSSALKRRFNFVRIPVVANKRSEAEIVRFRTSELLRRHRIELEVPPSLLDVLLQSFADLRSAAASARSDEERLESSLSTAEQIGVLEDAILHSQFFGDRELRPETLAPSPVGSPARRTPEDLAILNKFWHGVIEPRSKQEAGPWKGFLEGGREALAKLAGPARWSTRAPRPAACSAHRPRGPRCGRRTTDRYTVMGARHDG